MQNKNKSTKRQKIKSSLKSSAASNTNTDGQSQFLVPFRMLTIVNDLGFCLRWKIHKKIH